MKRSLTFMECRQLAPQQRLLLHHLFTPDERPALFPPAPYSKVHVAWHDHEPYAAFVGNYEDEHAYRVIRFSHPSYRDRHLFRGLLDRTLIDIKRHQATPLHLSFTLNALPTREEWGTFQSFGFSLYHETYIARLLLEDYAPHDPSNWSLHVHHYATRHEWMTFRNQWAHLFPDPFPVTEETFGKYLRQHYLLYLLRYENEVVGCLRVQLHAHRCLVEEIHLLGDEAFIHQGVSFIQHVFHGYFKRFIEVEVTTTTLQPELQRALRPRQTMTTRVGHTLIAESTPAWTI